MAGGPERKNGQQSALAVLLLILARSRGLKAASSKLVVFFCSSELKPIPSLAHSDQMARLRRIGLELIAQPSDVLIDSA
jgi:hypothetical protein